MKVGTAPVYPFQFQFQYSPPASAVGSTVTLTAKAIDKAGNEATSGPLHVNVTAAAAAVESPLPVGDPTLTGSPVVGQTLTCVTGGFLNAPATTTVEWLRNDIAISGATAYTYTLTAADLGRDVACRESAENSAGTGDATSEALTVSAAPTTPTPLPSPPGTGTGTPAPSQALTLKTACKLAASKKAVTCTITRLTPAKTAATLFVTGRQAGARKSVTRSSNKGKVTLTLRSTKRLSKRTKFVLKVRSGNTIRILTVKAS